MKKIISTSLTILLISASFAHAEIALKEYERVENKLGRAAQLFRNLAKVDIALDKALPRRDPLRALIDSEGNPVAGADLYDGPVLQGIVRSNGFTRALIEDQFYSEGDAFGPYKVQKIGDDGVKLEQDGSVLFVPLYRDSQEKRGSIV